MNLKKLISAAAATALLLTALLIPPAHAWSVYDTDYGMEWNEQSKTAVTDDMKEFREKDSIDLRLNSIFRPK